MNSRTRILEQTRFLADEKGDNEMIQWAVDRCPGIYLTAEKNPRTRQLVDLLMRAVRPNIASNWNPYLQMTSVGSHSTRGRKKEREKERMGKVPSLSAETRRNLILPPSEDFHKLKSMPSVYYRVLFSLLKQLII